MSSMSATPPTQTRAPGQLGALVRDRRQQLDLSMKDLADSARVSRSTVHRLEHGSEIRPMPSKLARILAAVGVDEDAIRATLPEDEYRHDLLRWMAAAPDAELTRTLEAARPQPPDLVAIHPDGTIARIAGGGDHLESIADALKHAGWMVTRPA